MYENPLSTKTKKDNFVKVRVKQFQNNYKQSLDRMRSSSSMNTLAGTMYSTKQNKEMSPRVTPKRMASSSKITNPEILNSVSMKGLNTRASHIPNYSDINTELLLEKKRLEEYIVHLKDQIAKNNRQKNNADTSCKKLQNNIEKSMNCIKELNIKSQRLNMNIAETRQDANNNRANRDNRRADNQEMSICISRQNRNVEELQNRCRILKNNLLNEEKNRTNLKADLIMKQKVMNSAGTLMSELEVERANLLLEINKSVLHYKLE